MIRLRGYDDCGVASHSYDYAELVAICDNCGKEGTVHETDTTFLRQAGGHIRRAWFGESICVRANTEEGLCKECFLKKKEDK